MLNKIIGSVLRAVLTVMNRSRLPQINCELNLPGLTAPVEVIRDHWGVPHVYADNDHDLFFAQGFVHAQDRLWQMELNRRTATGKLSEIFGEVAFETDRASRTFGFNRLGQADWSNSGPEIKNTVLAYTDGVNAFLKNHLSKMPVEFSLVKHRPQEWKPEDSMAFARLMIWQLSHAWYGEIIRARILEAVGPEHARELEIHYPMDNPITLPEGMEFNRIEPDGSLKGVRGPFLNRGIGSNAWVISGSRTTTGKPILFNDMHLPLMLPCIWYEVHLTSGEFNVAGVSLPGVPLVMVGHNARIAWGMTLAFTDCEDLFIEEFSEEKPLRYHYSDKWIDAEIIPEPIIVKGNAEPKIENVIVTRHGPIISDVVGYPHKRLAVNSMALRPCPALYGWYLLNQASNWDEFVDAMRPIEAPQLNVTYADIEGNIGYWVTGKVPIRARGNGEMPAPGWTGEYEWIDEVPFEEMPHALNPENGYIVTCNQKIVPDDYPHFLGNVWMNGYRACRITEVINSSREKLSINNLARLHTDFTCIPGLEFAKHLIDISTSDPDVQVGLDHIRSWSGQLTADSIGGASYEVTRYFLVKNLLEPALGKDLTNRIMGQGLHPVLLPSHEFYGHDTVIMLRMLDDPNSWWVAQSRGKEELITRSIKQAVQWLKKNLGKDPNRWQWGRIHRATFPHAMGIRKPLDRVFNCGPFPIGGDTDTPCQTGIASEDPYDNKVYAPTFRQITDMSDLSRSLIMHGPGQSGQLGSPHYDDFANLWLKGEYHPMLWTRDQIEREMEGTLKLKP